MNHDTTVEHSKQVYCYSIQSVCLKSACISPGKLAKMVYFISELLG